MNYDGFYVDVSGVGAIAQLNDVPCVVVRAFPFGFTAPKKEDTMTAYRERMLNGDYDANKASWTDDTSKKKTTTTRKATTSAKTQTANKKS